MAYHSIVTGVCQRADGFLSLFIVIYHMLMPISLQGAANSIGCDRDHESDSRQGVGNVDGKAHGQGERGSQRDNGLTSFPFNFTYSPDPAPACVTQIKASAEAYPEPGLRDKNCRYLPR